MDNKDIARIYLGESKDEIVNEGLIDVFKKLFKKDVKKDAKREYQDVKITDGESKILKGINIKGIEPHKAEKFVGVYGFDDNFHMVKSKDGYFGIGIHKNSNQEEDTKYTWTVNEVIKTAKGNEHKKVYTFETDKEEDLAGVKKLVSKLESLYKQGV